ncbi:MAG: phosphoglycerate kinase [Chitinophagaceae bacterium]
MSVFSAFNFKGLRALVRVDFNVPLDKQNFTIRDDNRIRAALPTIQKILADGGSVVLMSHLGRPKNGPEEKSSLKHLVAHLSELVKPAAVKFATNCIGTEAMQAANALQAGEVLLLENLRFHTEEEQGDLDFAKQLSTLGDVFVNDAFGTAHRAHASTAVIAQFFTADKKMFGLLMEAEVLAAEKVLNHAEKPFTAIVGGAKVSDKIMILENLLERASDIIIGGGMAYTFMKAQGGNIGSSLCEVDKLDVAKDLLGKAAAKGVRLHLPSDSVIADQFDAGANTAIAPSNDIPEGWMGLDIGPNACADFSAVLQQSRTILWNGPMGVFEMEKFRKGTLSIAEAVADATSKGAYSLVGGGDSVAAVNQFGYADKVSYVSTGGGAMLEFFEGKQLPGIAAIAR